MYNSFEQQEKGVMNFREKLRELRKSKNIKIRELAKKSEVSASYISMLENGQLANDPSEEIIHKIEKGLGEKKGVLSVYATTGATTALKAICANPENAHKMNKIMEEVIKDKKKLDKILKIMEE